jgi:hypothetical protein
MSNGMKVVVGFLCAAGVVFLLFVVVPLIRAKVNADNAGNEPAPRRHHRAHDRPSHYRICTWDEPDCGIETR